MGKDRKQGDLVHMYTYLAILSGKVYVVSATLMSSLILYVVYVFSFPGIVQYLKNTSKIPVYILLAVK